MILNRRAAAMSEGKDSLVYVFYILGCAVGIIVAILL
jgi:hypothetical protein